MEWPAWPRANEKDLPRYVTVGAKRWLPLELIQFDNRNTREGRMRIAESIYNSLLKKEIRYALEKYHPSEQVQEIRTPGEIFGEREGTCLDLALLFCGLCMANELLPMLIITEGHAFAAVSLTHGLREWNSYRPERGVFENEPLSDVTCLRKLIGEGSWLAVECTGFAYSEKISAVGGEAPPESLGREEGLMTFERATAAGREQLDYEARKFQFVFDIAVAHYHWNVPPYQIEPPKKTNALRTSYLNRLFEDTARLSLRGIDPKAAGDPKAELNLDAVYTALLTLTPEEHERMEKEGMTPRSETRRLSALALLNKHKRLVLLGDPGSGKTTFVNFVAMCMAGENLGKEHANLELLTAPLPNDEGKDQEERQPWDHGSLLPVRIILRDFAARGLPSVDQPATADYLWKFISGELGEAFAEYARYLKDELLEEGGLILLDGLDEVPEADLRRGQIKQAVEDFASAFPKCRVLVTSRTYAYQKKRDKKENEKKGWQLPSFTDAILAPFTKGQISRFVDRWYAHIAELRSLSIDGAQGQAVLLKRAIFGSERLYILAERPLLLTLMASLHAWRGGSLPEKREELYADAVELLLDWWEQAKIERDSNGKIKQAQPSLLEWLQVDREKVRYLLNDLAYQAHSAQPDHVGTADIPQD